MLNALNRIVASYDERIEANTKELELARSQLRDYQDRLGRAFAHSAYLSELTDLRDRLKVALSGTPAEGEPTAAELADRIKALKGSHTVEAVPMRLRETPKIDRVRKREQPVTEPEREPVREAQAPAETKPEDGKPEEEDSSPPGSFQRQVRKSVQRTLF